MSDVTHNLSQIEAGDLNAADRLLPLVYDQLRELAASRMFNERADHTLQGAALVHEAYHRLVDSADGQSWENRGHFFATAAEAMRRIEISRQMIRDLNAVQLPEQLAEFSIRSF